ncbi:MAG: hypothetical protein E7513_06660 [Ruminococcaceae bacterium]|nr:hypothetical protein [Oscillospiraceae bacterium]
MKYDLLFYKSRKTAYCEKTLKAKFSQIGMTTNRIIASVAPTRLGETLCESLTLCNCVVIIGGFSVNDDENLITVLSRAMSNSGLSLHNTRKIKGAIYDGYIIKYNKQTIIALPDNPQEIDFILNKKFLEYLKNVYI